MADVVEKPPTDTSLSRIPQPHPAPLTGPVGSTKNPGISSAQRVRPERGFASVQCDISYSDRQLGPLHVFDRMHSREPLSQFVSVDSRFWLAQMKPRLSFGHAVLHDSTP